MTSTTLQRLVEKSVGFSILLNKRTMEMVEARSVYYKVCREKLNMSYQAIGNTLNKDHATVMHSIKNVFPALEFYNPKLMELYNDLVNECEKLVEIKARIQNLTEEQLLTLDTYLDEITK